MRSPRDPSSTPPSAPPEKGGSNTPKVWIPSQILLSALTAPVLFGLLGGKAVAELLQSIGQTSEEVFRGDRLPVLNFPKATKD